MYKRRYIKHWQQFRREADETNGAEKEKESWSKKGLRCGENSAALPAGGHSSGERGNGDVGGHGGCFQDRSHWMGQ